MATGLTRPRLFVLAVLALAAHGAALWWTQGIWQPTSKIKLMAEPIYARLLTPKEPAPLPRPQKPKANNPQDPRAAVSNSNAIASRPLPEPVTPPKPPEPVKAAAQPEAQPKVAAAPKVAIPPPPSNSKPLFAALADDPKFSRPPIEEFIDEPARPIASPSPSPQPETALAQADPPALATSAPLATAPEPSPAPAIAQVQPSPSPIAPAFADAYPDWPQDTRINLKASGYYRGKVTGSGSVTWQRQQNEYQARVQVGFGLGGFSMTSQGEVTPEGLNPRIFEEAALGRVRSAQFEPEAITIGNGKRIARAGLPAASGSGSFQDAASQFIELANRFATGRNTLAAGATVSYWLGRPEGLYQYIYDISGPTLLDLPKLGVVSAYHLVPRPIPGLNKEAIYGEIWIAPSLQYLPVKIRMRNQAGTYLDLVVETVEQANGNKAANGDAQPTF